MFKWPLRELEQESISAGGSREIGLQAKACITCGGVDDSGWLCVVEIGLCMSGEPIQVD